MKVTVKTHRFNFGNVRMGTLGIDAINEKGEVVTLRRWGLINDDLGLAVAPAIIEATPRQSVPVNFWSVFHVESRAAIGHVGVRKGMLDFMWHKVTSLTFNGERLWPTTEENLRANFEAIRIENGLMQAPERHQKYNKMNIASK